MPDTEQEQYPNTSTFLAFDFSQNKIGIAVGQRLTGTANPLTTLINHNKRVDWAAIAKLLEQWQPVALIVGLPLTMNGEEQETTESVKNFVRQLQQRYHLPVHYVDERLTSREASTLLGYEGITSPRRQSKPGKKVKKHKQHGHDIDQLAAQLILQSWLNENG